MVHFDCVQVSPPSRCKHTVMCVFSSWSQKLEAAQLVTIMWQNKLEVETNCFPGVGFNELVVLWAPNSAVGSTEHKSDRYGTLEAKPNAKHQS